MEGNAQSTDKNQKRDLLIDIEGSESLVAIAVPQFAISSSIGELVAEIQKRLDAKKNGNKRFVVSQLKLRQNEKITQLESSSIFAEVTSIEDEIIAEGKEVEDSSNSNSEQKNVAPYTMEEVVGFLKNQPGFTVMQTMVRDNPSMQQRVIRQLIAVLKRASPQMVNFVAEHERELIELLLGMETPKGKSV